MHGSDLSPGPLHHRHSMPSPRSFTTIGSVFATPPKVFKIQRRKDVRFVIPQGYEFTVEFESLEQARTRVKKRLIDISESGLSFFVLSPREAAIFRMGLISRMRHPNAESNDSGHDARLQPCALRPRLTRRGQQDRRRVRADFARRQKLPRAVRLLARAASFLLSFGNRGLEPLQEAPRRRSAWRTPQSFPSPRACRIRRCSSLHEDPA